MRVVAGYLPLAIAAAMALAAPAAAKPALAGQAAGIRAVPPQLSQRIAPGRHGIRRPYHRGLAGYGAGFPGFYGSPSAPQVVVVRPEPREEPVKEPGIVTAVGIARPPQADPVLLRLENDKGRRFVRMIRIGAYGAQTTVTRR